ncbi:ATP-binding protein [Nonomuraea sp. NPDC049784]|uniref:sensor histidine kinase n=1 Tax=Nonomuraea sp. NPDC049784 TaxID=3154361 RepID=UPI0033E3315F
MYDDLRLLEATTVQQALERRLAEWSACAGIAVEVWALPKGDVPDLVAHDLYATVCEALANIERHSRARTVSIALTLGKNGLRLTVSDDGCGFPSGTTGRGLNAMETYFAGIGGSLTVSGVPGGGTTVSGVVPPRALAQRA